jgi:Protein of unknown function (DUF2934)
MSDADRIEQNIRMRAYLLWELEGRQAGRQGGPLLASRELIEDESHSAYPRRSPGGSGTRLPHPSSGGVEKMHIGDSEQ